VIVGWAVGVARRDRVGKSENVMSEIFVCESYKSINAWYWVAARANGRKRKGSKFV
jgi:hypothetical protein